MFLGRIPLQGYYLKLKDLTLWSNLLSPESMQVEIQVLACIKNNLGLAVQHHKKWL